MNERLLKAYVWGRARVAGFVKDESGEGVISAALVVLIMALLAALMWVAFETIWNDASTKTTTEVNKIGT